MGTMWKLTGLFLVVFLLTLEEGMSAKLAKPIKQVYRQFKQGTWREDGTNTVRYIQPTEDKNTTNARLIFSLDALGNPATINSAQLYFYRGNTEQGRRINIEVADVSQKHSFRVRHQLLVSDEREVEGWKLYNITTSVVECISTIELKHQLEVLFTEFQQPIDLKSFLNHLSSPYLLIHSHEPTSITQDQVEGSAGEGREAWIAEMNSFRRKRDANARGKRDVQEDRDRAFNHIPSQNIEPSISNAHWVDELNNEIESTGTIIVEAEKSEILTPPISGHGDIKNSQLMSGQMGELERRIVEEERKKGGGNSEKENLLPWPNPEELRRHKTDRQRGNKGCRRQSSVIHWEDLGWQNRIIAPKKFDSFVCSGLCTFPFNQGTESTNHATLHSLLRAIRTNSNKAMPCCVADKMSDLTVIYYNDFGNTVVKNYPNMVIDSCTCR